MQEKAVLQNDVFKIDILIENGIVLTMNADKQIIDNGFVAVKGDSIVAVGTMQNATNFECVNKVDAKGGIIMPGLINTHTHIAMSGFRGLADDLELMEWLTKHIFAAEAVMTRKHVYQNSLLSCIEMIMSGTTSLMDMYPYADEVAKAVKEAGLRGVIGETLYDFDSPSYGKLENGYAFTQNLMNQYSKDALISIAANPHSPYLLTPEGLTRLFKMAEDNNAIYNIHLAETDSEVAQIKERTGFTPTGYLNSLGVLAPRTACAHCVVMDDNDIALMAKAGASANLNGKSNLKLASGVSRAVAMQKAGIILSLGTDGCASNNCQDMFQEISLAAKLHKGINKNPTVMNAYTVLEMATMGGAKAMGMDGKVGSLQAGKKADVIIVDTDKPHLTPMYSAVSHLVYAVKGSDVCFTMVNGKVLMQNYQLTGLDKKQVMADVKASVKDFVQFM